MTDNAKTSPRIPQSVPARILKTFRSVRVAVILMGIIAVTCIVGTLIKQEPYVPTEAIEHYGRTLGLLVGLLGLSHLYSTWWFLGLLLLFALNTLVCAFSRARFRLRMIGSLLAHASILFIVAGAVVGGITGVNGRVTIEEGRTVDSFITERGTVPLGFRLRLDEFNLSYHPTGSLFVYLAGKDRPKSVLAEQGNILKIKRDGTAVEILRSLPHFKIDGDRVYSASDKPLNPAVEIRLTGPAGESKRWVFANHPEFEGHGEGPKDVKFRYGLTVKAYESRVTVLGDQGEVLKETTILVNKPLKVGRYTLYQFAYDRAGRATSTLEVSYDPGVPLVFIGFILLPLGAAFTFYVKPFLRRKGPKHV